MQQITQFQYFKDAVNYFFSRKKYIGKYYIIKGRKRKIIAETCYSVLFEGLKTETPKAYLKTIAIKSEPFQKSQLSLSSQN
jgi:hypothetical protein